MSLLDRIATCHRWDPEAYRPFVVGGEAIGRVNRDFATRLADFDRVFEVGERAVALRPSLGDFKTRSEALAEVLAVLREEGLIQGWRDEPYPVVQSWGDSPRLELERAAVPKFGVRGFGVHLNGFVRAADGLEMWVARRSRHKPTGPGKLDQIAAGGQPIGIGIRDNMIKESREEADIPLPLAQRVVPVGTLSYLCERPEGLRDDVVFCFDLELPADFEPQNTDGEVEAFYRWPLPEVIERLSESDDFKFNSALVVIDCLLRRGLLDPDDPDYHAIASGLQARP